MNASSEALVSRLPNKNVDSLISDISKLMAEAEGMLNESTSHHAEETVELFRTRDEVLGSFATRYALLKERVARVVRSTDEVVRRHPYESAAIAMGVGVVLGALASRGPRGRSLS